MPTHDSSRILARRSFFSKFGVGLVGGAAAGAAVPQQAQSAEGTRFESLRHAQDDWLDQLPGVHRFVVDTTSPAGFTTALTYMNNYFAASSSDYGLKDADSAVVIVARHDSTPFAYNDKMWEKYGKSLAERGGFVDPGTKQPPVVNVYRSGLDGLLHRGVHLAVCQMATRANASGIAQQTGGKIDDIYQELTSNLVPNSHMVPAGIVAVNRAQERGYAFAYGG